MDILTVGGSGFLGRGLARQAAAAGHAVTATFATRADALPRVRRLPMDLRRGEEITRVLGEVRPDAVINAAYRKAEWATTADGAILLARSAARHGARLVHVSSDAVFSGADVRYDESALPDPVTPYGAAKAAAETAIRVLTPDAVIARTSLIIGDGDSGHEAFVHDLAAGRRRGVLFTDDIRCPVHVADLAGALLELAASPHTGMCHLAGPDAVSRHKLGALIAARDGLDAAALTGRTPRRCRLPGSAGRPPGQHPDAAHAAHPAPGRPRLSAPRALTRPFPGNRQVRRISVDPWDTFGRPVGPTLAQRGRQRRVLTPPGKFYKAVDIAGTLNVHTAVTAFSEGEMATRCSLPSGDCLPPEAEVRWVYQPVEVHYPDGHWAVGRITAWWTDEDGAQWCRMRMTPGGQPPRWFPYDPDTIHLLPSSGI